jgi:hypothetical protein
VLLEEAASDDPQCHPVFIHYVHIRMARFTPSTSRPLKKSTDWRRLSPARTGSEMMAIANVGLDDAPAAVELAVRRCAHADAANSFGSRVRL